MASTIEYSCHNAETIFCLVNKVAFHLKSIHIYPVKSARGLSLDAVELDRFGPRGDRRWMLVDEAGGFVSQRQHAAMVRLGVTLNAEGIRLHWGDAALDVATPAPGMERDVTVWDDAVRARDAGDEPANWLSARLGAAVRLVHMPEDCRRMVDRQFARGGETVSFADGFPLLLVSDAALDSLNARLSEPVCLDRFRANLVVAGCEAHAEDGWKRLRIGDVEFDVAKPCARCAVPSLDQETGDKHPELLRVLSSYRRGEDRQVYFGQNLLYSGRGRVSVGDPVEVLA